MPADDAPRIAVIGAAGGIGRAVVSLLLRDGGRVVGLDLPASLDRHPMGIPTLPLDVLCETSVTQAARALAADGPLHGLVHLAGYSRGLRPLADTPTEIYDDTLAGNLRGTFLATRAILPLLAEGGSVVLVSSGLAQFIRPGHGAYAAAKAGVIALAKTFALETAPRLRVNVVAPGPVETAFLTGGTGRSTEDQPSLVPLTDIAATIPMGRVAQPGDVAGPIAFLLGDRSAFMTGQVLWVNGGAYMP